jgi:hypothetical protein
MFVCPSILDTLSIDTPLVSIIVAKECLARCRQAFFDMAQIGDFFQIAVGFILPTLYQSITKS